jgi:hypothetical protein
LQTCQVTSAASQVQDWVVYRLGGILGSVGHRVKIHKITPATGKERGDLEIKDYVVLQEPQELADHLPTSRTLILDFTLTHTRYGRSHVHCIQLTLQAASTMTLVVYCFNMRTVKHRLWLTKYRRHRVNFVCFVLPAMLILRGQWG